MSLRRGAKPPVMLSNTTRMSQLLAVPPTALAVPATGNTVGAVHVLQEEKPWKSEEVQGEHAYLMHSVYAPINEFVPNFQELYVRSRTNNLPLVPEDGNCLYTALLRVHDFHEGEGYYDADPKSDRVEALRIELLRIWDAFDDKKKQYMFVKHFEEVDYYIVNGDILQVTDFRQVRDWMVTPNTWGNTLTLELAAIYFEKTIVQLVHLTQNDWAEHGSSGRYLPPLVAEVYNTAEEDNSTDISSKSTFWNSHKEYYIVVLSPQKKHYEFYVSNELYKENTGEDPRATQPASDPYDDKAAKLVPKDDMLLLQNNKGKQPVRFSQASTSEQSKGDSDREHQVLVAQFPEQVRRQQELDRAGNTTDPELEEALTSSLHNSNTAPLLSREDFRCLHGRRRRIQSSQPGMSTPRKEDQGQQLKTFRTKHAKDFEMNKEQQASDADPGFDEALARSLDEAKFHEAIASGDDANLKMGLLLSTKLAGLGSAEEPNPAVEQLQALQATLDFKELKVHSSEENVRFQIVYDTAVHQLAALENTWQQTKKATLDIDELHVAISTAKVIIQGYESFIRFLNFAVHRATRDASEISNATALYVRYLEQDVVTLRLLEEKLHFAVLAAEYTELQDKRSESYNNIIGMYLEMDTGLEIFIKSQIDAYLVSTSQMETMLSQFDALIRHISEAFPTPEAGLLVQWKENAQTSWEEKGIDALVVQLHEQKAAAIGVYDALNSARGDASHAVEYDELTKNMRQARDNIVNLIKKSVFLQPGDAQFNTEMEGWLNKPSLDQNDPPTSQHRVTRVQAPDDELKIAIENARLAIENLAKKRPSTR